MLNGILWCDEGVHCLAKETQLMLNPEEYGMLFIGLGYFYCNIILVQDFNTAVGKYQKASGIGKLKALDHKFWCVNGETEEAAISSAAHF